MRLPKYFGIKNGNLTVLKKEELKFSPQYFISIDTNNNLKVGKDTDMDKLVGI